MFDHFLSKPPEVSYKKLWVLLAHKEIPKAQLRKDLGIASSTLTKLNKNDK